MRPGRGWPIAAAFAALLLGMAPGPAAAQLDYAFMPKGGKALLLEVLSGAGAGLSFEEMLSARRTEDEWRELLAPWAEGLSVRERQTLAVYLEVNLPVRDPGAVAAKRGDPGALYAALPRDGRELAWHECQFCHSLFTSHLTQDRGVQAWMNMFESPFHREMKMTPQEREEFSRYSAINMPMKMEDVPPDLRF
ncbi:MAG: hypothetical protein SCH98_16170 [Deferrisomatales bacterium]|nr:hypothetical protein [Deferrisomatales bacterium]